MTDALWSKKKAICAMWCKTQVTYALSASEEAQMRIGLEQFAVRSHVDRWILLSRHVHDMEEQYRNLSQFMSWMNNLSVPDECIAQFDRIVYENKYNNMSSVGITDFTPIVRQRILEFGGMDKLREAYKSHLVTTGLQNGLPIFCASTPQVMSVSTQSPQSP